MNQDEAKRALELLRQVVQKARDDTALQNWGLIWIVCAFTNAAAFSATNVLWWRGVRSVYMYCALWSVLLVSNLLLILLLKRRKTGVKSFIENQVWSIWMTFIGAVVLVAVINELLHRPVFELAPIIAVLSGFGFSQMGSIMGRGWYLGMAAFVLAALLMALFPSWQFIILGVTWGSVQLAGGLWLEREKRGRKGDPHLV